MIPIASGRRWSHSSSHQPPPSGHPGEHSPSHHQKNYANLIHQFNSQITQSSNLIIIILLCCRWPLVSHDNHSQQRHGQRRHDQPCLRHLLHSPFPLQPRPPTRLLLWSSLTWPRSCRGRVRGGGGVIASSLSAMSQALARRLLLLNVSSLHKKNQPQLLADAELSCSNEWDFTIRVI